MNHPCLPYYLYCLLLYSELLYLNFFCSVKISYSFLLPAVFHFLVFVCSAHLLANLPFHDFLFPVLLTATLSFLDFSLSVLLPANLPPHNCVFPVLLLTAVFPFYDFSLSVLLPANLPFLDRFLSVP